MLLWRKWSKLFYTMPAHYDSFDYPSYWESREYEHWSEVIAIRSFLEKIPSIKNILEVGCGYGRLLEYYAHRGKKIVLTDPCVKMLAEAKKRSRSRGEGDVIFVQSKVENLGKRFRRNQFDMIIMVRVTHHLENLDEAFEVFEKLLKPGGYLILEFANKLHSKALLKNILTGNFTFPLEIFPTDNRSQKSKTNKTLPFFNYHPDKIVDLLHDYKFDVIDKRSVSNVRSTWVKKHFPQSFLLEFEKSTQKLLSSVNFGPSVFLLARKI